MSDIFHSASVHHYQNQSRGWWNEFKHISSTNALLIKFGWQKIRQRRTQINSRSFFLLKITEITQITLTVETRKYTFKRRRY